ncbi:pyruvate, phosphate dikinase [Desulfobotulus sp. H1]|uniref:Pyruvate, phosphate dikinase n=1 Tax=Desulfobotulus pelophilus TaxID=2823377 RepID=A0ABT3N975_9BACT|nr:pyruvate, phosphate dikinase [Desulfobotulus pelophilus]MCW7753721.1 pyruvate, phosphate dikinase [Desulfobotulus pelophilus]
MTTYVYSFGNGMADGDATQADLLGGKGANLAEMSQLGLPVPAGFTLSTDCCNDFLSSGGSYPPELWEQVRSALTAVEESMGMKFGDRENPLLVSCRSGARQSMPGMMETVLNVGLCPDTIPGLIRKTGNERFVYDAYRRLIMMYADVVMEKAEGIEPIDGMGIRSQLDRIMEELKEEKNYVNDTDIPADDLKKLCELFKAQVQEILGIAFPDNPEDQLWGAIGAVFKSWNGRRAIAYRRIEGIPDQWGTACTVQSMVFGNMGASSATGVAFTRNPANGENRFYGEWLPDAQGEDVVAGIRTPNPLNNDTKNDQNAHLPSLEEEMPVVYKDLYDIREKLEKHYHDMLDIEFTIQEERLYMLQCRVGKRTGPAALNMAMDMLEEGLITEKQCVMRVKPSQLDELLHPIVDPDEERKACIVAKGLPAGPGGAFGQIVFTAQDAVNWQKKGKQVILVREETNPEDVEGMRAAEGILTARGGMTSHAALVARGWGKCCIVGAAMIKLDFRTREMRVGGKVYKEGDVVTLNGSKGLVYEGALKMMDATENPRFKAFMSIVDKFRTMGVRTNADSTQDTLIALEYGAEGIGLFRTEHMFYGGDSDHPLFLLRKMILSDTEDERRQALEELFPFMKRDIQSTLATMDGMPVTIRLLDPPLHEFVPHGESHQKELAAALDITTHDVIRRGEELQESNPMMGHRGVRLGITYPEITEMQVRAILEAAAELIRQGKNPMPEIMVPVTCDVKELVFAKKITDRVYADILKAFDLESIDYKYGTMIEIPRAALLANKMAEVAEFFSFGTNDLTQMTFGFSRDDTGGFMSEYLDAGILDADPFQTIDQDGMGQLIEYSVERGRKTRPDLKIGICGEHGGDPASVAFCYANNLTYVSCSPFRIPIARLAAAQAALKSEEL